MSNQTQHNYTYTITDCANQIINHVQTVGADEISTLFVVDCLKRFLLGYELEKRMKVSLTYESLSTLITLCDARAHNLQKMIERGELADEDECSDAENMKTHLIDLAVTLREARDKLTIKLSSNP